MNLKSLRESYGVCSRDGVERAAFQVLEEQFGRRLPADYKEVLLGTNGLEVYHGYFRLFGYRSESCLDSVCWNDPKSWKFAWPDHVEKYWCFGETVWGDQFAYETDNVVGNSKVYLLDALTMDPQPMWDSFSAFFQKLIDWASTGGESQTIAAHKRFGPIQAKTNLVYSPPVQISGSENIADAMQLNAVSAMTINGDIASQLEASDRDPLKFETYEDALGRMRMRILF